MFRKSRAPSILGIPLIGIAMLAVAGCAPTVSDRMGACIEQHHDYPAMRRCEIDVLRASGDQGLAKWMEINDQVYEKKLRVLDTANKARRAGAISDYDHALLSCTLAQGYGCSEVHAITPDGETSDSIVTWSP